MKGPSCKKVKKKILEKNKNNNNTKTCQARNTFPFRMQIQSIIPIGKDTSCGIEMDNALLLNEYITLHYRFQQKLNLIATRVLKMPVKTSTLWYLSMLTQFRRLLQTSIFTKQ